MSDLVYIIHCKICGKLLKRYGMAVYEHADYCNKCWQEAEE